MSDRPSLLEIIPTDELAVVCRSLERFGRDYWEKSWDMGLLPEHVHWYKQHSAIMYAEARRVRAEALKRTDRTLRSASVPSA